MIAEKPKYKVTVLLSTYNGEKYLDTQLRSLKEQQGVQIILAVRDDASNDGTCKILERFAHEIPLTIIHGENVGPAKSFMKLVHEVQADTDYYAFCDQDDYWQPNKLIKAIEKLENFDSDIPTLYYSNLKRAGAFLEEVPNPFKKYYHTEEYGAALISTAAAGCTMVFNKSLMLLLKEYVPEYLVMHDSWTLLVCAAVGGEIIYDDDSYILYRQHVENVFGGMEKMRYGKIRLFMYRMGKLFNWDIKHVRVAEELLSGYKEKMPEENLRLTIQSKDVNKSLLSAMRILIWGVITKRYYTPYRIINFKYFLQVLFKEA